MPAGGHSKRNSSTCAAVPILSLLARVLSLFNKSVSVLKVQFEVQRKNIGKKIQIKVLCGSPSGEFKVLYEQPHFPIKPTLLIVLSFSHVLSGETLLSPQKWSSIALSLSVTLRTVEILSELPPVCPPCSPEHHRWNPNLFLSG